MIVDLVIKNGKIYTNGGFVKGNIAVDKGKIVAITEEEKLLPDFKEAIDLKGKYLLPGSIDTHVHLRDPGRPDRETFETGTAAAAAGGVTTILEHPISTPPPYTPDILKNRIKVAEPQAHVDYAFYGAASAKYPGEIHKLAKEGIVAFKSFLHEAPNGREEEFVGLTMDNDGELFKGLEELSKTGLMCVFHAENNDIIQQKINDFIEKGKIDNIAHAESRPPITEYETVSKVIQYAKETGAKVGFAHISTPQAMELIKQAKYEGLPVYLETCPHYLFLSEEDLIKHGPFAKCNPPLRKKEFSDKLWDYVNDGSVDYIGSDHGPFLLSEKEKGLDNIFNSPAGFPGVELRLPLMLNAVNEEKITMGKMIELLVENPAKVFGIYPQKGVIRIGSDADFVIVDMNKKYKITSDEMYTKAKDIAKVYENKDLKGKPITTIVRGKIVMQDGIVDDSTVGWGNLIKV